MLTSRITDEFFAHAQSLKNEFTDSESNVRSSLDSWRQQLDKAINARPGACLVAALAVGVVLGWWTKRK